MTLAELFYNIGLGFDAVEDWFGDGSSKLDQGLFMQLTIGQGVFTVLVVTIFVFCVVAAIKDFLS